MEALRFYPPIYMLGGKCLEDIVISTSKEDEQQYLLEKGTQVLFANMVLNCADAGDALNLDLWDLPREEQPFLNTFNNGEHVCPGKALSLVEAHVFLLMVATKFRFSFPGGEPCMDAMDHIMLKPVDGMPLLVTER
jgi:cytochrome P450